MNFTEAFITSSEKWDNNTVRTLKHLLILVFT